MPPDAFIAALIGRTRRRRTRALSEPESVVWGLQAVAFLVAAVAIAALVPWNRQLEPLVLAALVLLVALFTWIELEVGTGSATPAQLAFLPLLLVAPLPLVPALVALALLLEKLPGVVLGRVHVERWLWALSDAWFAVGPVLVLAALAPGEPRLELAGVYALALAAQMATGSAPAVLGQALTGDSWRESARSVLAAQVVDGLLTPAGLLLAWAAATVGPPALLGLFPLGLVLTRLAALHNGYWRARAAEEAARWARDVADQRRCELAFARLCGVESVPGHWRCVLELAPAVAAELGRSPRFCRELAFVARVGDLGKRQLPLRVLRAQAPLVGAERAMVEEHPLVAASILDRLGAEIEERLATAPRGGVVASPLGGAVSRRRPGSFRRAAEVVRSTHERWDGGGRPDGLHGREIPLAARIIACCEAYSAKTAARPYRAAMSAETALEEVRRAAGTELDPDVCTALERVVARGEPAAPQWTPQPAYQPLGWPVAALRRVAPGGAEPCPAR